MYVCIYIYKRYDAQYIWSCKTSVASPKNVSPGVSSVIQRVLGPKVPLSGADEMSSAIQVTGKVPVL